MLQEETKWLWIAESSKRVTAGQYDSCHVLGLVPSCMNSDQQASTHVLAS